MLVVLNDLSHPPLEDLLSDSTPSGKARAVIEDLVGAVRAVRHVRGSSELASRDGVRPLVDALMPNWSTDRQMRDKVSYLRRMADRAPYDQVSEKFSPDSEYRYRTRPAQGLGTAHMVGGLAVSLSFESDQWDATELEIERTQLIEKADLSLELSHDAVSVPHARTAAHVMVHRDWIGRTGLTDVSSGAEIWATREDYFPGLRLLPRVENQLTSLQTAWVHPVKKLLADFQQAVQNWTADSAAGLQPTWPGLVTPEHQARKRDFCEFDDAFAGGVHAFDWHARFTPGAGRMHFRWSVVERKVVIAHIGQKLGA